MKLERKVTADSCGAPYLSSISILDVGKTYGISCASNIAVFNEWTEETYMEYSYTHKGSRIPARFLRHMGLNVGDKIRIMKDDSCVFIFRSDFNGDLSELNTHMPYCAAIEEAPVIAKEVHEQPVSRSMLKLPFDSENLVVTSRVKGDRIWLELRPDSDKYRDLIPELYVYHQELLDGFSWRIQIQKQLWKLPKDFEPLVKGKGNVQCGFAGDVFVIEGPKQTCNVCGREVRTSSRYQKGCACPNCARLLGKDGIIHALTETAKLTK